MASFVPPLIRSARTCPLQLNTKAIERAAHAAHDEPVIVLAAAQAGTCRDLRVEIAQRQLPAHARQIIAGLHRQDQTVAIDRGAAVVRGSCVPHRVPLRNRH